MHLKLAQPRCTPARLAAAVYGSQGDIRARRWTEKQHCHNLHFVMQASCQCLSACEFLGRPQHTTQLLASLGHITELCQNCRQQTIVPATSVAANTKIYHCLYATTLLPAAHLPRHRCQSNHFIRIVVSASGKVSCGYLTTYYYSSHPSLRSGAPKKAAVCGSSLPATQHSRCGYMLRKCAVVLGCAAYEARHTSSFATFVPKRHIFA